jgi:hypothetical protein
MSIRGEEVAMFKNREFKVGDEVVDIYYGNGMVTLADGVLTEVSFEANQRQVRYYLDGKINNTDAYPSLFHRDNNPFEMAGKRMEYAKLAVDGTPTPKPKINRAELLEVVKAMLTNGSLIEMTPEGVVANAVRLLNDVNKVCDGE